MHPETPSHDDPATTSPTETPRCPVCWTTFTPTGRQRYCSDRCRKTAYNRRQAADHARPPEPAPAPGQRRAATVYACPDCDTRYHGEQWCPDCNTPCTRLGHGGPCPHCQESVTITDLLDTTMINN